jgi:hypothetical protein
MARSEDKESNLVDVYQQTTQCHIPEDSNLHSHCSEYLRSDGYDNRLNSGPNIVLQTSRKKTVGKTLTEMQISVQTEVGSEQANKLKPCGG